MHHITSFHIPHIFILCQIHAQVEYTENVYCATLQIYTASRLFGAIKSIEWLAKHSSAAAFLCEQHQMQNAWSNDAHKSFRKVHRSVCLALKISKRVTFGRGRGRIIIFRGFLTENAHLLAVKSTSFSERRVSRQKVAVEYQLRRHSKVYKFARRHISLTCRTIKRAYRLFENKPFMCRASDSCYSSAYSRFDHVEVSTRQL